MRNITPTPWRIGAIESGMVAIDGANGEEVTGFVFPEDGRLIAAAPELLDELLSVLDWAVTERAPLRNQEIESIRKVIAKATGEQP